MMFGNGAVPYSPVAGDGDARVNRAVWTMWADFVKHLDPTPETSNSDGGAGAGAGVVWERRVPWRTGLPTVASPVAAEIHKVRHPDGTF